MIQALLMSEIHQALIFQKYCFNSNKFKYIMEKNQSFQIGQNKGLKKRLQNYFFMTFLNWLITIIYYRRVVLVSEQNNPESGPRIVYSNHHNLFLDAWVIGVYTKGYKNLLVAAKTFNQKIIGTYSRLSGCIPISTAKEEQDGIIVGITDNMVYGKSTAFKTFKLEGQISFDDSECYKIKRIVSNTVLQIDSPDGTKLNKEKVESFYIHSKKAYLDTFNVTFDKLKHNQIVIIFVQSQLNMSQRLFSFKHGMAKMALQFYQLNKDKQVKLCPWVFHHYNSHHWRSVLILDLCKPFCIPQNIKEKYCQDKRSAISELSDLCRQKMNQKFIQIPQPFTMITVTLIRKIILFGHFRSIGFEDKIKINREISKFLRMQNQKNKQKLQRLAQDLKKLKRFCSRCGEDLKAKPNRNIIISFVLLVIFSLIICLIVICITPGLGVLLIPTYFVRKLPQDLRKLWQKRSNYEYRRNDLIASFRVVYGFAIYMLTFILVFFTVLGIEIFRQRSFLHSFSQALLMQTLLLLCCIVNIVGYDWIQYCLKVWRYNYSIIFEKSQMQAIQELRGSLDEALSDIMGKNIQEIRNIVK